MSNIILRQYQEEVKADINKLFETEKKVVMAMCPGAGKTITALSMAEEVKGKVLVLAHGTNVIKSQWFKKSEEYGVSGIQIEIPQSAKSKDLEEVDLLIVDEAHEFFYAKTVQDIIKKTNPKKILLLTGTPSKFIRKKIPLVLISADKLIEEGFLSDVYFSNVSSKDPILKSDYNVDGDVRASVEHKSVEQDLGCMLKHAVKRLKATITKDKPTLTKLTSWTPILGKLHKTLIACRNIAQAKRVAAYFRKNSSVGIALSDSHSDTYSEEVERFVEDDSVKVLIVVRRGVLGFDHVGLVNVIDLTGSRNVDRIYQLMARVMRKDPNNPMKYFFKIAPEGESAINEFYLRAAISMTNNYFMSNYNGKNLSKMEMPYSIKKGKSKRGLKGKIGKSGGARSIDPELFETVDSIVKLTQLYNKSDSNFNEISYITLSRLKHELGETVPIKHIARENLEYMIKTGEVDPRIF